MKKNIDKQVIVEAGSDLVSILTKMALAENDENSFLIEYMDNITSDDGIYKKQQDALAAFSESSKVIESSAHEIMENTSNNTQDIDKINTIFSDLNKHIDQVFEQRKELDREMAEISGQIKQINQLIQNIQDISEQTNLLSFNASIEAAHAGEMGKGFRIIANEVKNLSSKTSRISTDIVNQVNELNKKIQSTTEKNNSHNEFLEEIRGIAENSKEVLNKIKSNTNENADSTSAMYKMVMESQKNIQRTSEEVEASNRKQIKKIGSLATNNSLKTNERLSFLVELNEIFKYMKSNEI